MDYSLNYKDYMIHKVECKEDYKIVKLGDICEICDGYAFKTNEMIENGMELIQISNINNYKIDNNIKKCIKYKQEYEKYTIKKGDIILGMTGNLEHKIALYSNDTIKILNQRVCKLVNFENSYISNYIYFYWLGKNVGKIIENQANGSVQKNISKAQLNNLEIAIPINIETIKPELEKLFKLHNRINEITNTVPLKELKIQNKINELIQIKDNYDEYLFGNIIEYQKKNIKYKASIGKEIGKYKFYTSSQDKILFIDEPPLFTETMLIMGRNGIASVHYDKNFSCEHDHVYVIKVLNTDTRYVYYNIKNNIKWFSDQMNGSTIRGTSKEILGKYKIKILRGLKENGLITMFDEIDDLKMELENIKLEYRDNLYRLFKNENEIIEINEEKNIINDNIENKPEKKIVSRKKNINSITI
jgi:restriction endonuclease S subunit